MSEQTTLTPELQPPPAEQQPEKSERWHRRQERIARVRALTATPRVRVIPREDLRAILKHPSGIGFLAEGSVEWPLDNFTKRRIADGTITIEEAAPQ